MIKVISFLYHYYIYTIMLLIDNISSSANSITDKILPIVFCASGRSLISFIIE